MTLSRAAPPSLALCLVLLAGTLLVSPGPAEAQTEITFADEFDAISFSGSNGTASWSGPWAEVGEADGPGNGVVRVAESDRCRGGVGSCLRIGSPDGYEDAHGAMRSADLDGASSAVLSFEFRREREGTPSGKVKVQISSDGGESWTTLLKIRLKGSTDTKTRSRDITQHATDTTTVRFIGTGTDDEAYLHIDHVMIVATYPPETTTTTTAPETTTTTTPPPTTTTEPPGTTTTSLPPAPPAPTTTTTSRAGSTTTTAATSTPPPSAGSTSTTAVRTEDEVVTTTIDTSTTTTTEAMVAFGAGPPEEGVLVAPVAGLQVPFATNSEVFSNNLFSIVALALLTGLLSVAGLETRRKRSSRRPLDPQG